MASLRWTEEALRWLEEIHSYIAEDNPTAAQKVVNEIYAKAQKLKDFPQLGYRYRHRSGEEIRVLLYGHYRIAYLIQPDDVIEILGVFHGALDIDRHLP